MAYILNDAKRVVGRISNTGANNYVIHVTLEEKSTEIATNTSSLYYKVWLTAENDAYVTDIDGNTKYMSGWAFDDGNVTAYVNINGSTFASAQNSRFSMGYPGYGYGYPSTVTILEGTKSITHNDNGELTVAVTAGITNNNNYGATPASGSLSKTAPLTTIARASSISASNATMGSSTKITITANSSSFSHTINYSIGNSGWKKLADVSAGVGSYTFTVPDWCANFPAGSTSQTITYQLVTKNGSSTVGSAKTTTATISMPGASTASVPSSYTLGSSKNITISRGLSSYTHTVTYTIGSKKNVAIATKTSSTTVAWSPDTSLGGEFPSSNTGGATIYVTTYAPSQSGSGTTQVGSTQSYSTTIGVPSGAGPISNGFTASFVHTSGSKAAEWGIAIKGYSKMTWSFSLNSSKLYGASVSYTFSYGGQSGSAASGTTGLFNQAANAKPKIVVKDSRNNSITVETSSAMVVYDYGAPVIVSSYAYRSDANGNRKDDGTCITYKINAKTDYTCGGKNSITVQDRVKESTGSWSSWFTKSNNVQYISENYAVEKSYQFELRVVDSLGGTKSVTYTIPTASVAFNIKEGGKGAAFFGYAQSENELAVYAPQIRVRRNENQYAEVIAENDAAGVGLLAGQGGRHGLYSETDKKWMLYHEPSGTVLDTPLNLRSVREDNIDTYIEARNTFGRVELDVNSGTAGIWGGPIGKEKWLIYTNNGDYVQIPLPLRVENHASAIGTTTTAEKSVSTSSGTWSRNANSITLSAGSWLVISSFDFSGRSGGMRRGCVNTSTTETSGRNENFTIFPTTADESWFQVTRIFSSSSNFTVYNHAFQSSGASLTCYGSITAVRIA